ncbi:MAG TPA: c-type cytochrome [Polyangia bacterium]|nr:c-type cytochrome [Polyangia bacterium]
MRHPRLGPLLPALTGSRWKKGPGGTPTALAWLAFGGLLLGGCRGSTNTAAYLGQGAAARRALEASVVNPKNAYSALRLARYQTGAAGDWTRLPIFNPPAEPIAAGELDQAAGASATTLSGAAVPLALPPDGTSLDDAALLALGRQAFARYPTQLAGYMRVALTSRAAAARTGLWVDPGAGVGGLVRARMPDGSVWLAVTCATCHTARAADGRLVDGLPNAALDVGRAILESQGVSPSASADPRAAWGPGRLDVSTTAGTEPARIPDLRPVRWLTHLHQDATLRGSDPVTLAIRLETLIITANDQTIRPPRIVTLALAAYVRSLGDGLPAPEAAAAASPEGAAVFAASCAECHAAPGFTGPPVALSSVGTDPTLGRSADRGTGTYRVPSLRGVGSRGPLLHDGTIPSVAALFDPARLTAPFAGRLHGAGPVSGHVYGLSLSDADRRAVIAYLEHL